MNRWFALLLVLALVLGNIVFQSYRYRNCMVDRPFSSCDQNDSDGDQYAGRAEILAKGGSFADAFGDGYRLPAYPFFLSLFYRFSPAPLISARKAQILLSGLVIALFYLTLRLLPLPPWTSLCGAAVAAIWVPFYYFTPIIMAETVSLLVYALLCLALAGNERRPGASLVLVIASLIILVYLKPNHLVLLLPTLALLAYIHRRKNLAYRLRYGSLIVCAVLLAISPWSIWLSLTNGTFIPLATTQGINLYMGAGLAPPDETQDGSLPEKVAQRFRLYDKARDDAFAAEQKKKRFIWQASAEASAAALSAWKERPLVTALYGFSKILNAFGFSFRGLKDCALAAFTVLALFLSYCAWRRSVHREWCLFFWGVFLMIALQSFLFLPYQRFNVILFHYPALIVSVAVLEHGVKKYRVAGAA